MAGILLFILIVLVVGITIHYEKSQSKKRKLSTLDDKILLYQNSLADTKEQLNEIQGILSTKQQILEDTEDKLIAQQAQLDSVTTMLQTLRLTAENEKQAYREKLAEELVELDRQHQASIKEKSEKTKRLINDMEDELTSIRSKYLSSIETAVRATSEEEDKENHHVMISDGAKEDISYLLNNVANRLSNPDVLYKLIWSEYIQKPTNEMLDYILPHRDCAGIYKITNDRNKKAYIGRSTSVRKRLTDHVKSSVGISTIADQRVHKAMREEGIWNFTFELIEECPREQLNEREKYYIQFFSTEQMGYNQKAGG